MKPPSSQVGSGKHTMLIAYLYRTALEPHEITVENQALLKEAIWIDLFSPTKSEESLVEHTFDINLPTRKKMSEIESSSRLYTDDDAVFMTAITIAQLDSPHPNLDPVTFVLTPQILITLRYVRSHSFKVFSNHLKKLDAAHRNAGTLLIELLDATIDYLADILELVGSRLDEYSKDIFQPNLSRKFDYRQFMQHIGEDSDLNTKARESLTSLNRLLSFFEQTAGTKLDSDGFIRLTALKRDIDSLSDHAHFLSTKVNFLLDATLGMISIEQNNIIKIFSVAAVIFLPPTLVASIYGMNFWYIPELSWKYGYLFSIGLIIAAAWLPYKYFKYKKWL
jgi:magnesium transporter